jgi:hypothetical protein
MENEYLAGEEGFEPPETLSSLTVFDTIGIKRDKRVAQFALLRRTPNLCNSNVALGLMAEEGGFEPPRPFRA